LTTNVFIVVLLTPATQVNSAWPSLCG